MSKPPDAGSPPANRRRRFLWATAAAAAIAVLLAGLNLALGPWLDGRISSRDAWLLHSKWALAHDPPAKVEWLFLGDSACSQALDPEVWEQVTGQPALNLCTTEHGGLVEAAWLFNWYLREHENPRNVVVLLSPRSWQRAMDPELVKQVPLDWSTLVTLRPRLPGLQQRRWELARHRYLPLFSRRGEWMGGPPPAQEARTVTARGFTPVAEPDPAQVRKTARADLRAISSKPFALSEHTRQGLNRIAFLAQQNEMRLWIISAPVAEGLAGKPAYRRFANRMLKRLEKFASKHPNAKALPELPTLPREQMVDSTHPAAAGAAAFTATLVRALGLVVRPGAP